jgi:hypothetical protein
MNHNDVLLLAANIYLAASLPKPLSFLLFVVACILLFVW